MTRKKYLTNQVKMSILQNTIGKIIKEKTDMKLIRILILMLILLLPLPGYGETQGKWRRQGMMREQQQRSHQNVVGRKPSLMEEAAERQRQRRLQEQQLWLERQWEQMQGREQQLQGRQQGLPRQRIHKPRRRPKLSPVPYIQQADPRPQQVGESSRWRGHYRGSHYCWCHRAKNPG